jgi:import inner membrane translocase subunit TIM17
MMREKPCPYRIVDDLGGGFTIGFMLGSVWHFARGMYYSPKS